MLANREAAVHNLIELKPILGEKWFVQKIMATIRDFIKPEQKFMIRIFALRIIELALPHLLEHVD